MQPLFFCKPKKLGRWAVGPLMIGDFCATSLTAKAQAPSPTPPPTNTVAGKWNRYYEIVSGDGSALYSRSYGAQSMTDNFLRDFRIANPPSSEHSPSPDQAGFGISGSISGVGLSANSKGFGGPSSTKIANGTVKVIYRWEPVGGPGTVPTGSQLAKPIDKLSFRVRGSASAGAASGRGSQGEKVSATIDGKTSSDEARSSTSVSSQRLFSFDPKGQTEFSVTMSGQAEASIPGNRGSDEGNVSAYLGVGSELDARSVSLSRLGAVNEWTDNDNGSPVTHGDTIYSFTEHQSLQTPEYVPVPQKFASALAGNWSTGFAPTSGGYNVTWNWGVGDGLEEYRNSIAPTSRQSGAASYTYWNGLSRVSEKGELEYWYTFLGNTDPEYTDGGSDTPAQKGKSPKTATVKYFVRDNQDQAEAEARYELTLHEPVEIVDETKVSKEKGPFPLFDNNGNLAYHSGIVQPGQTDPAGTHNFGKTGVIGHTTGWSFGGGGGVNWGSIKKLLGGAAPEVGINGDFHWDNSVDYSGTRATYYMHDLTAGQSVYITYTVGYNEHSATYRSFSAAGENRSATSPAIVSGTKPLPSVPYEWKWQTQAGTSLGWKMIDTTKGQSWPDYSDNSETILPSGGSS